MNNFALYLNETTPEVESTLEHLKLLAVKERVNFLLFDEQFVYKSWFPVMTGDTKIDCILVLGGDGTILRAVKYSLKYQAPLLGINLGHLGFLSEGNLSDLERSIHDLRDNKYKILSRMMLKATVKRAEYPSKSYLALNDVVISKGESPKLINLKVYSDRRYVYSARCDGMIAASPTGSTAYALSAGGPIISPVMDAIVVVPITPHVLTVRPLVFPPDVNITFVIEGDHENCCLQVDGCNYEHLQDRDMISITSSSKKVDFIKLSNRTFYKVLRQKMHLGRR
ncbi:MAG: NAD(+)/NADH kinase [Candidatus Cloacimonetes bacterium]|nr:NAD(+)/NADH kinase [Candidatus Cloacimonadota bacterium]